MSATPTLSILCGDVLEKIKEIPDNSIHCVVTSPPYFQLRDYNCPGQIGLEPTIEDYLAKMVQVFTEVRRVLRDDGILWLNMGDSYSGNSSGSPQSGLKALSDLHSPRKKPRQNHAYQDESVSPRKRTTAGLKPKDLMMMPARVALALQASGWYLRCDIIWFKPNPMPESVYDRPTKSHEYIFLLSKSQRYFYDAEAIREKATGGSHARGNGNNPKSRVPSGWDTTPGGHHKGLVGRYKQDRVGKRQYVGFNKRWKDKQNESFSSAVAGIVSSRNRRSVWEIGSQPFSDAHFATFPPDLVKPCILAGTSAAGCCSVCGAPLQRVVENGEHNKIQQKLCGADRNGEWHGVGKKDFESAKAQNASRVKANVLAGMRERKTVNWEPTCKCKNASTSPCIVLDPFGGSGTTGMVALELGRSATLIELNPDYVKIIEQRCNTTPGLPLA